MLSFGVESRLVNIRYEVGINSFYMIILIIYRLVTNNFTKKLWTLDLPFKIKITVGEFLVTIYLLLVIFNINE